MRGLLNQRVGLQLPVKLPRDCPGASTLFLSLLSADLGKSLRSWFGPPDERVPGKYRRAEVFCFDANDGNMVVALCEPGDRGSNWFWVPHDASTPGWGLTPEFDQSPVAWREMVIDLARRFQASGRDIDHLAIAQYFQDHGLLTSRTALKP